jgi:hypothetical protein
MTGPRLTQLRSGSDRENPLFSRSIADCQSEAFTK